jgi:hypothetical protein
MIGKGLISTATPGLYGHRDGMIQIGSWIGETYVGTVIHVIQHDFHLHHRNLYELEVSWSLFL